MKGQTTLMRPPTMTEWSGENLTTLPKRDSLGRNSLYLRIALGTHWSPN